MDKFCGKCGVPLDAETGRCPKCRRRKQFIIIGATAAIAIVLLAGIVANFSPLKQLAPESEKPMVESTPVFPSKTPETEEMQHDFPVQTPPLEQTEAATLEDFLPPEIPEYAAAYLQVIQETEKKVCTWAGPPIGELFDLNSDGVPEMALSYPLMISEPYITEDGTEEIGDIFYRACDLYTYENGTAVPLLEQKNKSAYWDGSYGEFAFVEKDGRQFFLWEACLNGAGYLDSHQERYFMDGHKLVFDRADDWSWSCSYEENEDYSATTYTVNGVKKSETAYNTWYKSFVTARDYNWREINVPSGIPLNQLKRELELGGGQKMELFSPLSGKSPVKSAVVCSTKDPNLTDYDVKKLLDDDLKTNWTSKQEFGYTDYLRFELEEKTTIYGICIWSGNHYNLNQYLDDSRLTSFFLSAGDVVKEQYALRDMMNGQIVLFDQPINSDYIELCFDTPHPGRNGNYKTVISEIDFLTADMLEALASGNAVPFAEEKSSFISAYTNILQDLQHNYGDDLTGQLEDINHDDIPELAVCYPLQEKGVRYLAYNLYTYSDNHVQTLVENEKLNTLADGHFGGIKFATINGAACFATYTESIVDRSYRPAGTSFSSGQWKTYILDNSQMQCDTDIEFEMYSTLTPEIRLALNDDFAAMMKGESISTFYTISEADFNATLNGEEMSYYSYLSWDRISRAGWRNTTYGSSAQKLIDKLQTF